MTETAEVTRVEAFLGRLKELYGPRGTFTREEASKQSFDWPEWENHLEELTQYGRIGNVSQTSYRIAG